MAEPQLVADDPDREALIAIVRAVAEAKQFYIPVGIDPTSDQSRILQRAAQLALIHWCPYPEEFYIVHPAGRDLLHDLGGDAK